MTGRLVIAQPGLLGCDTSGNFPTDANATALEALGYHFAIRYLLVHNGLIPKPLTPAEVTRLHAAGVAIGLIQAIPTPASMTAAQGTLDGTYAAQQATALGAPKGLILWCDFEGGGFPADPILIGYLNNWALAVQAAGYPSGLYNGPQNALNGSQIGALVFPHYWKANAITNDPPRGYQIKQGPEVSVPATGTAIDVDVVDRDHKGDLPTFWGPA